MLSSRTIALLLSCGPLFAAPVTIHSLPLLFERNGSQFISRTSGCSLTIDARGASFCGARLNFDGANPAAEAFPEGEVSYLNEYLGSDASHWRTHVPAFGRVRFKNVYPGIDLVYYSRAGKLEYDFLVDPGADPGRITLSFEEADKLTVDGDGNALIGTARAVAALGPPSVFQEQNQRRLPVTAHYVQRGPHALGIAVGQYDQDRPLVIDPVLYATYLGGSGGDSFNDIKLDPSGNLTVVGSTNSADFPKATGAANGQDAVVVKLNASGTAIAFVTLIGGSGSDSASKAAVDSTGAVYVLGSSGSVDFPYTSGAYLASKTQAAIPSSGATPLGTFVAKLSATGALVYNAQVQVHGVFVNFADSVYVIAVDGNGRAIFAGTTGDPYYTPLPVTDGAFQRFFAGGSKGFIGALNPGGSGLAFMTYLGGNSNDSISALAVDSSGAILVAGQSVSSAVVLPFGPPNCASAANTFPITPGAYRSAFSCYVSYSLNNHGGTDYTYTDSFVAKLNASGSALIFSTYAPDPGNYGIASLVLDGSDNIYLGGVAQGGSGAFGGPQSLYGRGFVAKMSSSGSALLYSANFGSYSGASAYSLGLNALALDVSGGLVVTGSTSFPDFPNDTNAASASSPYVVHFDAQGKPLASNVFTMKSIGAIAVDASNAIVLAGTAAAGQLTPSAGSLQANAAGATDGFIERLTLDSSNCNPTAIVAPQSFQSGGGTGSVSIGNVPGCLISLTSSASWLTFDSAGSTNTIGGSGSLVFYAAPNFNAGPRSATLTAGSSSVTITQAGTSSCSYSFNPTSAAAAPGGSTGFVTVGSTVPCAWTAVINADWLSIPSYGQQQGVSGRTFSYSAAVNTTGSQRIGTISFGSQTFTVTQGANNPSQIPALVSLNPFQGAGPNATLTFVYAHPSGWAAIQSAEFIVNPRWEPNTRIGGCYVKYAPVTGLFTLVADDGTAVAGTTAPGSGVNISNSQCTLNAAASSATGSGNNLTVVASLTFTAAFSGQRHIWMQAVDYNNLSTNWLVYGVWFPATTTVTAGPWYRIYDPFSKSYLYSADPNEYATLGAKGFVQQGISGLVMNGTTTVGGVPNIAWYRVYVNATSSHFWTSDRNEFLTLVNAQQAYVGEGVAAFVMPYINAGGKVSPQVTNTVPFWRAAYQGANLHFWTADPNEYNGTNGEHLPAGYVGEGIACYIFPASGAQGIGTAAPEPGPVVAEDDDTPAVISVSSGKSATATGVVVPGQLLTIHGRRLGGRVLLGGVPAQVVSAGENELQVVAPADLTRSEVNLEVEHRGRRVGGVKLTVVAANPTILSTNPYGRGNAEARNEDGSANGPDGPAARGSAFTFLATGFAADSREPVEVHVGGHPAEVVSVRQSETNPGVVEVTIRTPDVLPAAFQPLVLRVGNLFSQPGIGLAIR